jgi:hypothetical protein
MHVLRIEHPVPDYDRWKAAFDSDPADRERSGVRRYRILRTTDDPNYVMIDLKFDNRRSEVPGLADTSTPRERRRLSGSGSRLQPD